MHRRHFIATATVLLMGTLGGASLAADAPLSGPEVAQLLTGNTAEGVWNGTPYRSYFDPDGETIYVAKGSDPITGKWRVNPDSGAYESFWDTVGWTSYPVLRTDDGLVWINDGKAYPFSIVQGRDLGF